MCVVPHLVSWDMWGILLYLVLASSAHRWDNSKLVFGEHLCTFTRISTSISRNSNFAFLKILSFENNLVGMFAYDIL